MVLQYEYWPSLTWVQQLLYADEWELEQWGNYQKQSLANRCRITGAHGPVTLSVPLVAGREQKAMLQNVRIDNTQRWQVQHLRTIKSCYGKAPFFDHYFPAIENMLLQPYELLVELDTAVITFILKTLKLPSVIRLTESFQSSGSTKKTDQEFHLKSYVQVFSDRNGFVPGLSILDALFCLGPQVVFYLTA
jgi:hypothetical protein